MTFLPVRLAGSDGSLSAGATGSIEVLLRGERRLRLDNDFDEAAVLRLVRLLEGSPC
jgi:hypothetical protein